MRTLLYAALLLAAAPAAAALDEITRSADTAYYADPASITVQGELRRVGVVHDYATPEPGGVRSRRVTYEIDCAGERLRSTGAAEYAMPMAQGSPLQSWERTSDWANVAPRTGSNLPPATPYRAILRFVCAR